MVYRQEERERSKPLSPPFPMTWGTRMIFKCKKVNSNGEVAPAPTGDRNTAVGRRISVDRAMVSPSLGSPVQVESGSSVGGLRIMHDGVEAVREERREIPPLPAKSPSPPTDGNGTSAWNLRTRRAPSYKAAMYGLNAEVLRNPNNLSSSVRNESMSAAPSGEKKRNRAKFSVSLSLSEIEQDFMAMTGHRLPRRPNKKRPMAVRKVLENLSPAMWLTEVRPDHYKVPDSPKNNGKVKFKTNND